jgi:hypothetical protein
MLSTREEILKAAHRLAQHLHDGYQDPRGDEWTDHVFGMLCDFSESLGLDKSTDCCHKRHAKHGEFLWDFIAYKPEYGILLAAESEQHTTTKGQKIDLRHDFEKLLYVFAPIRLLMCKAKDETHAEELRNDLNEYAGRCCQHFNSGAVFLIHFCLWNEKGTSTYLWQCSGEPAKHNPESLDFNRLAL